MAMPALPNLHLKLNVFREILSLTYPDAQIALEVFGGREDDRHERMERATKFSRLIYGDLGCAREHAEALIRTVNQRIEKYREMRGLRPQGTAALSSGDLELPLYDFTRRLLMAVDGKVPAEALRSTHQYLLDQLAPRFEGEGPAPELQIERYSNERMFEPFRPSGSGSRTPMKFKAGRDRGRLTIGGFQENPVAAYVMITRDPAGLNQHLWDLSWGETVMWLPSPLKPVRDGDKLVLMDTQPVRAVPGRFLVTAVLVLDGDVLAELDGRPGIQPGDLDEAETSRFLTKVRRLANAKPAIRSRRVHEGKPAVPIAIASGEYAVSV
jgi:hypothetical protein